MFGLFGIRGGLLFLFTYSSHKRDKDKSNEENSYEIGEENDKD